MYIIIIGGGRVGYYLTKSLLDEGHEILIVEKNATYCQIINDELGTVCYQGDGCEIATLEQVGTRRADMLIAVTGQDQDNLVACQVAKHRFKVPRTIARIRNPGNVELFRKLGVDVPICSTMVILERIAGEVPTHPLIHLQEITDRGLEIVDVKISADSTTIGKAVRDIELPAGTILLLLIRKGEKPFAPIPGTVLMGEDEVIAVIDPGSENALRTALRGDR